MWENFLPIDLIIEIFSRLPTKSIARCRCVSKPWSSFLRRSDFTELFLTRSSARPQLLFALETNRELLLFSSPQPQNPDQKSSSTVVAKYHLKFSCDNYYSPFCGHVPGLVFTNLQISKGYEETVPVIYNPSTGQSLLLPKVETKRRSVFVFTMLGFDPIDKQFKLLSMTYGKVNLVHEEHQVLTLGNGKHTWRMIKCCRPHYSLKRGICIDGVLYYTASDNFLLCDSFVVVCFDVKSEKFRFIRCSEKFIRDCVPINYNGKLGLLGSEWSSFMVDGNSRSIELCVLEDAQKHEWSKHTYVLPTLWKNMVGNKYLYIVGMTRTNEIVLAVHGPTMAFYVFYYNIKRKTTVKLQIQGMEAFENKRVHIFLDHVVDLKLI